jgi:hypothetical protein
MQYRRLHCRGTQLLRRSLHWNMLARRSQNMRALRAAGAGHTRASPRWQASATARRRMGHLHIARCSMAPEAGRAFGHPVGGESVGEVGPRHKRRRPQQHLVPHSHSPSDPAAAQGRYCAGMPTPPARAFAQLLDFESEGIALGGHRGCAGVGRARVPAGLRAPSCGRATRDTDCALPAALRPQDGRQPMVRTHVAGALSPDSSRLLPRSSHTPLTKSSAHEQIRSGSRRASGKTPCGRCSTRRGQG